MSRQSDPGRRTITVDSEVFAELQQRATPLVDDANAVIRRLLKLPSLFEGEYPMETVRPIPDAPASREPEPRRRSKPSGSRPKSKPAAKRAPKGSLLPEEEYERPLLEALVELGGAAPSANVIDLVGSKLEHRLTDLDRETIKSGDVRWRNRVQFVRLGLLKQGLMAKDSPRGTWAITDEGAALLGKDESDA